MAELKQTLVQLYRLQQLETDLAAVERELAAGPARVAAIERTLEGAEKALAKARDDLKQAGKQHRDLESEVESIKEKISRYQTQLLEVKTNEQYRALNNEIAAERGEIDKREDQILELMERSDELSKHVDTEQARLAKEHERVDSEKQELAAANRRLAKERADIVAERDALVAAIDPGGLKLFRRVAEQRGTGLTLVNGETCAACRVRCRPQMVEEARTWQSLVQCEQCSRILYVPPQDEDDAVDDAGPAAELPAVEA